MEKAAYTTKPATIKKFFQTIQDVSRPSKVTYSYLPIIGFKSSNDRRLIGVLKFLGFVDDASVPTQRWNDYKNKEKAAQTMTSAIKSSYDDLFSTYADAEKRDNATIHNYFAQKFGLSAQVAKLTEQTFKQLCELADFEAVAVTEPVAKPSAPPMKEVAEIPTGVRPITININIQLQLPATEDTAIYDNLFSALKKHFFS